MTITPKTWTFALVILGIISLAINYRIIEVSGISLSFDFLSVDEIKVNRPDVFITILVFSIGISMFFHFKYALENYISSFISSYRKPQRLTKYLNSYISQIVKNDSCGVPLGNIDPHIFNKVQYLGTYRLPNGRPTEELMLKLPFKLHIICLGNALFFSIFSRETFFNIFPLFIGVWAILKILI